MLRIDLGPEKTAPVPQSGLDRSVVAAFLATLHAAGSSVCLLHTGGDADSRHWQGDVDLLVTSDRAAFLREMHIAAASLGFSVVMQVPRLFNTIEIDLLFPGSTSWTVVFVDRHGVVLHVDAAFAPGSAPEIDEETGLTYVILKRLRKGDLDPEAWARIAGRARRLAPALEPYLGDRLARAVTDAAVHGEVPDPAVVREAHRALRARRNRTPRAIRALARAARVAARRSWRPAGAFVSLGGVDGSGKTAVTDALMDWSPFRQARRLHARPGLLKPMGWFVGRSSSDGRDPHGSRPWGRGMSAVRLAYYWADFAIGYWVRLWPVRARGGLVVCERWWWDMYVDPRRHRIRPMPRAAVFLGRLVPRPDVFIVLDAPSNRIHERKRELAISEIERQRTAWAQLAPTVANLRTVDATAPLPDVIGEVTQAVLERQRRQIDPPVGTRTSHPRLVAFPRAEPRWLVDPEDARSMSAALHLYMPSRLRAVAVARGIEALAKRSALSGRILRRLGDDPDPEAERAVEWIREAATPRVPGQRLRMTAYLGSPGPLQKVSALVLDRAGHPALFAKVGTTAAAIDALRNEAQNLKLGGEVVRSAKLPEIVAFEVDERGAMLLLTPVLGSRFGNRTPATERHLRLIGELLTVHRPLDGAAHRDSLSARLEGLPDSNHTVTLRTAMRLTQALWPAVRSAHLAHGDLTPWNCLDCGGQLGVVDWEMAGYRIPGWDVLHYLVQIEAITRTGPVGPAAGRILRAPFLASAGDVVTRAAEIELPTSDGWEALKLLVLIESAVDLLSTQPHLSHRGVAVRAHAVARLLGIAPPDPRP